MFVNNIPGFFNDKDIQVVQQLGKKIKDNGIIVEIGSFVGRSAVSWAKSVNNTVDIICIDRYVDNNIEDTIDNWECLSGKNFTIDDIHPTNDNFIKYTSPYKNIQQLKGYSPQDIYTDWDKNVDLVFIDAAHSNYELLMNNLCYWLYWLKDDGILCGHDFRLHNEVVVNMNNPEGKWCVIQAVIQLAEVLDTEITIYGKSSFWVIEDISNKQRVLDWWRHTDIESYNKLLKIQ